MRQWKRCQKLLSLNQGIRLLPSSTVLLLWVWVHCFMALELTTSRKSLSQCISTIRSDWIAELIHRTYEYEPHLEQSYSKWDPYSNVLLIH